MGTFHITFAEDAPLLATFAEDAPLSATFGEVQYITIADWYEGEYEITPSPEAQTLPISGKTATQDITIGAIPNNYGLITWNGSTLTVS